MPLVCSITTTRRLVFKHSDTDNVESVIEISSDNTAWLTLSLHNPLTHQQVKDLAELFKQAANYANQDS